MRHCSQQTRKLVNFKNAAKAICWVVIEGEIVSLHVDWFTVENCKYLWGSWITIVGSSPYNYRSVCKSLCTLKLRDPLITAEAYAVM